MKAAGVKKVGGFCGVRTISNRGYRGRTSARFEGVGTKGKDIGGEAGFEECRFIGRYSRGERLSRNGHCSNPSQVLKLTRDIS